MLPSHKFKTTVCLQLLEASVPQLCEYLNVATTAMPTLHVFLNMAEKKPTLLADHISSVKAAAQRFPHTVCVAAQVIGAVGKLSKVHKHTSKSSIRGRRELKKLQETAC